MKNEIIFISTIHRMSERVASVMNRLQDDFDVKIINSGQSSFNTEYPANLRYKEYISKYFSKRNIFNTPGLSHRSEAKSNKNSKHIVDIFKKIVSDKTVAVILDDSRCRDHSYEIYSIANSKKAKVFSNFHGNTTFKEIFLSYGLSLGKFYDHIFVMGDFERDFLIKNGVDKSILLSGGIPENDSLKLSEKGDDYILVIPNFILKREVSNNFDYCDRPRFLDAVAIDQMKLGDLQQKLGKKIVFKVKDRMSTSSQEEVDTLISNIHSGIDYEIIHNIDSENDLISNSSCILGYGSTMMMKAIQMGIPTIMYREFGHVGNFIDHPGVINLSDSYDKIISTSLSESEREKFLKRVVAGGYNFNSTHHYLRSFYDKL